jgi:hypothetical protein
MMDGTTTDEEWVSVDEAAVLAQLRATTIMRWCISGQIESRLVGSRSRVVRLSEVRKRASVELSKATDLGRRLDEGGSTSTREAAAETDAEITELQRAIRERPRPGAAPKKR